MEIERDFYLSKLVSRMGGDLVKVITGIRRCGKSYLLFNLFKRHLLQNGVKPGNIVEIALDERKFQHLRDPLLLSKHISDAIKGRRGMKYVFIDEIQFFRKVLAPGVDLRSVAKEDRESARSWSAADICALCRTTTESCTLASFRFFSSPKYCLPPSADAGRDSFCANPFGSTCDK